MEGDHPEDCIWKPGRGRAVRSDAVRSDRLARQSGIAALILCGPERKVCIMSAKGHRDTRPALLAEAFTLPALYYTDPERFRGELEAIHYRSWLCVGRG